MQGKYSVVDAALAAVAHYPFQLLAKQYWT